MHILGSRLLTMDTADTYTETDTDISVLANRILVLPIRRIVVVKKIHLRPTIIFLSHIKETNLYVL